MEPTQLAVSNGDDMRLCYMAAGLVSLSFMSNVASAVLAVASAVQAEVQSNYGKLSLSFEASPRQTDVQMHFCSRARLFRVSDPTAKRCSS